MSVELHLPDLPEVPISLGPAADAPPRAPTPWHLRLRDALSSYLPLLLMTLLALATWWLVQNSPRPEVARPARVTKVLMVRKKGWSWCRPSPLCMCVGVAFAAGSGALGPGAGGEVLGFIKRPIL